MLMLILTLLIIRIMLSNGTFLENQLPFHNGHPCTCTPENCCESSHRQIFATIPKNELFTIETATKLFDVFQPALVVSLHFHCHINTKNLPCKCLCIHLFHTFVLDFNSAFCCVYFSGTCLSAPSGNFLFRNVFEPPKLIKLEFKKI